MGTQRIWIITTEILVQTGDPASGQTKGFTNVVTWADSQQGAQQEVSQVLKSYGWEVLGFEALRPFEDSRIYEDGLFVDQASSNPEARIIGTVFTYKPD